MWQHRLLWSDDASWSVTIKMLSSPICLLSVPHSKEQNEQRWKQGRWLNFIETSYLKYCLKYFVVG